MRILVIEDEKKTASYLRRGLTEKGFTVDVAGEGQERPWCRLGRVGK